MDPHPYDDRRRRERLEPLSRGLERSLRRAERDEERVALRIDLDAGVRRERGSQQPPMLRQDLGVRLVAERAQELRRPLDIGEQERDRAVRQLARRRGSALPSGPARG